MPVLPDEWGQPDSFPGLIHDVLWAVLAILVFGALAYFEPFSIHVTATPGQLSGAGALGISLCVAVSYLFFESEQYREVWSGDRHRFGALFVVAMGVQVGLMVVSTWTVLTLLATFLTAIPIRLYVYVRMK